MAIIKKNFDERMVLFDSELDNQHLRESTSRLANFLQTQPPRHILNGYFRNPKNRKFWANKGRR